MKLMTNFGEEVNSGKLRCSHLQISIWGVGNFATLLLLTFLFVELEITANWAVRERQKSWDPGRWIQTAVAVNSQL